MIKNNSEYALYIINNLPNLTPTNSGQSTKATTIFDNLRKDNDSKRKLAYNVSQRFKKKDHFAGKLGENIEE